MKDSKVCHTVAHGVVKSWAWLSDWIMNNIKHNNFYEFVKFHVLYSFFKKEHIIEVWFFFLVKGKWFIWSEEKPEYYWGMTDIQKSVYIVYNLMYLCIKIHPWNHHHNQCHQPIHHQTAPNGTFLVSSWYLFKKRFWQLSQRTVPTENHILKYILE